MLAPNSGLCDKEHVSLSGVFGELDLHGLPHSVYKTKLSETAEAGSRILSLMDAVDWQVENKTNYIRWVDRQSP